jgi:hypothetical protein
MMSFEAGSATSLALPAPNDIISHMTFQNLVMMDLRGGIQFKVQFFFSQFLYNFVTVIYYSYEICLRNFVRLHFAHVKLC